MKYKTYKYLGKLAVKIGYELIYFGGWLKRKAILNHRGL